MDSNFINVVRNNFEDLVINVNSANIQRAKLGFVNSDCDLTKSMLSTICLHCIQNPDIFNEEQTANIINIINILSYD